ncbi:conserved hypothetical protein [uncultured Desulfobacterium sp.]|uniref:Uncharacterized protein n=1 Tax=uncultured Desulfobacterium sp. TaxID=201089 RepID=A0A445MSQ0_9BACT|nr:conserved hypothetical protein [uncultured Desulfobacterium sp.]
MVTAVQLRSDEIKCMIIYGKPLAVTQGKYGDIAIFSDNCLVIYSVEINQQKTTFLFKTSTSKGTVIVPGVFPKVDLLCHVKGKEKTTRVQTLVRALAKKNIDPANLDSAFYLRLGVMLNNRVFSIENAIDLAERGSR